MTEHKGVTMKASTDLLRWLERLVGAVATNVGAGCGERHEGKKIMNKQQEDATTRHPSCVSDMPHSRVFVYVDGPPVGTMAGDEFRFTLGSLWMKAVYPGNKIAANSEATAAKSVVAAVLPTDEKKSGLQKTFFEGIAKLSEPQKFYVKAPPDVQIGETFEVLLFGKKLRIRLPNDDNVWPGNNTNRCRCTRLSRYVCCSKKDKQKRSPILQFRLDSCFGVTAAVQKIGNTVQEIGNPDRNAFFVKIPTNTKPGEQFPVIIENRRYLVTCPANSGPGKTVRIVIPSLPPGSPPKQETQLFQVNVPPHVQAGSEFLLLASGNYVLVKCPENAGPGRRIRFGLPVPVCQQSCVGDSRSTSGEWVRAVRAADFKLQWVPLNPAQLASVHKEGATIENSVFLPHLTFRDGNGSHLRDGSLSLIPAGKVATNTKLRPSGSELPLCSYSDLAAIQRAGFLNKTAWFHERCAGLADSGAEGYIRMGARRSHFLEDLHGAVMSLSRRDLRKPWRILWVGEPIVDGPYYEWVDMVCKEILDPALGLWQPSDSDPTRMAINPESESCFGKEHLDYFRFFGRVLGKALLEQRTVSGRMAHHIYKYLLGWPLQFKDLGLIDEEYFSNLKRLQQFARDSQDVSMMCLDFTTTIVCRDGRKKEVELVQGGADIEVTNDNLSEYLEACFKYKMMGNTQPQLTQLLLGFANAFSGDALLAAFDIQEFELLLHGLPRVDVRGWKANVEYAGDFRDAGVNHAVCRQFWEVVEGLEHDMKVLLFESLMGCDALHSNDRTQKLTIVGSRHFDGIRARQHDEWLPGVYAKPSWCSHSNVLELPLFLETKEALCAELRRFVKEPSIVSGAKP